MPIEKERLQRVIDEGLAWRQYAYQITDNIRFIIQNAQPGEPTLPLIALLDALREPSSTELAVEAYRMHKDWHRNDRAKGKMRARRERKRMEGPIDYEAIVEKFSGFDTPTFEPVKEAVTPEKARLAFIKKEPSDE